MHAYNTTRTYKQGISPRAPNGHGASLPPATRRRPSTPLLNGASSGASSAASSVLSSIGIGLGGGGAGADGQKRVD